MTATISTPLGPATLRDERWTAENEKIAALLNQIQPLVPRSGADPNRDLKAAQYMVSVFPGSKVTSYSKEAFDPKVVY
jgi:hypothetical protein